jgi:SAM-dependent methyltransferase
MKTQSKFITDVNVGFCPKVNYLCPNVARSFDLRGVVSPERMERLAGLIKNLIDPRAPGATKKILDIGCGTGRFSIPLSCAFEEFTVIGADSSHKMLEQAQQKPNSDRVVWSIQEVRNQTFEDASFDLVFVSDLLHHLDNPLDGIRECHRVLRPGGWLLCKYGAMENIVNDPEHTFFPETVPIDAARTPTQQQLGNWMSQAGFGSVSSHTEHEQTRMTGADRLAAARAKSISVLHMIEEHHFERGLNSLSAYVEQNPDDSWLMVDPTTLTWGQR